MRQTILNGRAPAVHLAALLITCSAAIFLGPLAALAQDILPGWELYTTDPNFTSMPGLGAMQGVPLGTYDFGNGAIDVDTTDTIIQRTAAATPDNTTINIQMVALQLETQQQVNFNGNGNAFYFITLQSSHGGTASTGTDTITFTTNTSGTFTESLNLYYDIRMGSLTGTIVDSGNVDLMSMNTWGNNPPLSNPIQLTGVNTNLNGTDNENDFWVNGLNDDQLAATLAGNARWAEYLRTAALPEPSSWVLALIGAAGLGALRLRGVRPKTEG